MTDSSNKSSQYCNWTAVLCSLFPLRSHFFFAVRKAQYELRDIKQKRPETGGYVGTPQKPK
jgi:hypothetical protein